MLCRVAVAHQPLSLLIHHRDPIEFVGELLRIQIVPEMTFVDRGLGAARHQLPPISKRMHHAFTHRMPQTIVIFERGLLQWAAAQAGFTANPFQFFLEQDTQTRFPARRSQRGLHHAQGDPVNHFLNHAQLQGLLRFEMRK